MEGRVTEVDGDGGVVNGPTPREGDGVELPPCAICGHCGGGPRTQCHLTHGIAVWLCQSHGSDGFLKRRGGLAFTERLARVWAASGIGGARRAAALQSHLRRIRIADTGRIKPGSYSWPVLREEAERRFAAGEVPNAVIADLRSTYTDGPAMVPSIRTMRRWFSEARWLGSTPRERAAPPRGWRSSLMRPGVGVMPRGMTQNPVFPFVHPWKDP